MRSEDPLTQAFNNDANASWTSRIKDELAGLFSKQKGCQEAEAYAVLMFAPESLRHDEESGRAIYEEPAFSGKNRFTARRKTYSIKVGVFSGEDISSMIKSQAAKRAFLRGAFLAAGSFADPEKGYQLEITASCKKDIETLLFVMECFGINAKVMQRRGRYVAYIKDGSAISDFLNVIGAHRALLEFENIRIIREMRGSVNRQVNCDTANINKSVRAAARQVADIELIREARGLDSLDDNLRDICEARLKYPDAALSDLGNLMKPPLGKSGVNHRMRRIAIIADDIRKNREKENRCTE